MLDLIHQNLNRKFPTVGKLFPWNTVVLSRVSKFWNSEISETTLPVLIHVHLPSHVWRWRWVQFDFVHQDLNRNVHTCCGIYFLWPLMVQILQKKCSSFDRTSWLKSNSFVPKSWLPPWAFNRTCYNFTGMFQWKAKIFVPWLRILIVRWFQKLLILLSYLDLEILSSR